MNKEYLKHMISISQQRDNMELVSVSNHMYYELCKLALAGMAANDLKDDAVRAYTKLATDNTALARAILNEAINEFNKATE